VQGNLRRLFAVRTALTNYKSVSDPFQSIYRSDLKVDFDKKDAIWQKGDMWRYSSGRECNAKNPVCVRRTAAHQIRSLQDGFCKKWFRAGGDPCNSIDRMKRNLVNKFSKRLAVALMTCAAAGAAACQEQKKPEDKPAASTSAPAPMSEAAPDKTATPPAAEPQKPADTAASTPTPAPEPEKKVEAPATPAPAPAAEPEKKAEAPAAPAAAPAAQPEQVAQATAPATPAPAASSGVPNPDDPNSPPPGSRKPDGDAVYPDPVSELAKTLPDVK
jgi:hypothetical protein